MPGMKFEHGRSFFVDDDGKEMAPIEIRFHQETQVVESLFGRKVANAAWIHFDSNNHPHAFKGEELPTLDKIALDTIWVGDAYDGHEETVYGYQCKLCQEAVEPKWRMDYTPEYVTGPPAYTLYVAGMEYPLKEDDVLPLIEILKRCGVMTSASRVPVHPSGTKLRRRSI